MYSLPNYTRELLPLLDRYKADNVWFKWWPKDPLVTVSNAWRMYKQSSGNALGFLLLGDTAIRTNKALLFNFGLTSAHGVQEQKDVQMIEQIMGQRRGASGAAAVQMLGPGSILSDKEWSPLLNDAFVLGGVNGRQEFHLADDAFHAFQPPPKPIQPPSLVAQARAQLGGTAAAAYTTDPAKEKWKAYFQANPSVFWGAWGAPRVFAREVLGMKAFGYRPVFTLHELAFDCVDGAKAGNATFGQYLSPFRCEFRGGRQGSDSERDLHLPVRRAPLSELTAHRRPVGMARPCSS